MSQPLVYDLIIIGAGSVGIAASFYATSQGKSVLVLQQSSISDPNRYWSSSFSARQNRVQYTERYLTEFVVESNKEWKHLEDTYLSPTEQRLKNVEGALWFGEKSITTNEGNILQANAVINDINNSNGGKTRIQRLYMETIYGGKPDFFNAFKKTEPTEWDSWSALYQPDGGSINIQKSYNFFKSHAQQSGCFKLQDSTKIVEYRHEKDVHTFVDDNGREYHGTHIFVAAGIWTPYFLTHILKEGGQIKEDAVIQEYVASYFKINPESFDFFDNFTTYYNFLKEDPANNIYSAYGFPFHSWDSLDGGHAKLGTLAYKDIPYSYLEHGYKFQSEVTKQDDRVKAAIKYVTERMTTFVANDPSNRHFTCPIIFYNGRQTILDYLNRKRKTVVVQTGGWVGKYFPLLAKTAVQLLFHPEQIKKEFQDPSSVIGNFLNRTRFPIRLHVESQLTHPPQLPQGLEQPQYDVVVVGAGCSGLYATYRLHAENLKTQVAQGRKKLAVFDQADRISGRLLTINFQGTSTPMELGGMRYIPENHHLLKKIIDDLGIPSLSFEMAGDPIQEYSLRAYLRDDIYDQNEWTVRQTAHQRLVTAYRIKGNIVGMSAFQMIAYSFYLIAYSPENKLVLDKNIPDWKNKIVHQQGTLDYATELELKEWNLIKPQLLVKYPLSIDKVTLGHLHEDQSAIIPLYKLGFQNVIQAQFGHQAYNFIAEQNGYFSNTSNASYLEQTMVYLLDFGNVTYRTLSGGFDMVNYNLANQILDPLTGIQTYYEQSGIFLQHRLINIVKDAHTGIYEITFEVSQSQDKKTQRSVKSKSIILGMPKRSIELIANQIPLLRKPLTNYKHSPLPTIRTQVFHSNPPRTPANIYDLIKSTQNMPSIKIILNFDRNWWDPNIKLNKLYSQESPNSVLVSSTKQMRGVSVTDLPIRQTLYFSTATDNFLLASYNDMITTQYWETLNNNFTELFSQNGHKAKRLLYTATAAKSANSIYQAKTVMVREVLRQLSLVHSLDVKIEWVKECLYQNWEIDPFGGGYHNWYSGYDVEAVMKAVRKPWKEENIHFVGEAYSNLTGWVEGAFQVTERLLIDEFKLPPLLPLVEGQPEYIGW